VIYAVAIVNMCSVIADLILLYLLSPDLLACVFVCLSVSYYTEKLLNIYL